jgi:DNA topoisomerase VI subunit B
MILHQPNVRVESDAKPEKTIEPRRMLPRTKEAEYVTLEGLQRLTGEKPENFDRVALKELMDNALDICDETASKVIPRVSVKVEKLGGHVRFQVSDNGQGMNADTIKKICNFKYFYSARFHYKSPTRGALGNAWKVLLGMNYALHNAKNAIQDLIIILSGKRYFDIHVGYANGEVQTTVRECENETETMGTTVILTLPEYEESWGKVGRYLEDIKNFVYQNPQATITYQDIVINALELSHEREMPRESPHSFSETEMVGRYQAQIQDETEREKHSKLDAFIRQFHGLSKDLQVKQVLQIANMKNCLAEKLLNDPEAITTLHKAMKQVCNAPSPKVLGKIGKTNMQDRLEQIDGLLSNYDKSFRYKIFTDTYTLEIGDSKIQIPYALEVGVGVNNSHTRNIYIGLNRSIKQKDPFGQIVFFQENNEDWVGIKGICKKNGISEDQGVTVIVSILCPNIQYEDPGKTQIDTDIFDIADTIDKATKFYKRAKKRVELLRNSNGETDIPEKQKEATFGVIANAVRHETSDGKYPYYKQRMLWYTVCEMLEKKGFSAFAPEYKYFPLILDWCKEKGINLDGLLLEANSILHEPRNNEVTYLSTQGEAAYEIPQWKYNKVLHVEKKGFQDVILANRLHDKLDATVIGGQGQPAKAVRVLLQRIEQTAKERNEQIDIYSIHDADIWGSGIYLSLSSPTGRMKSNRVHIVDLGLSILEGIKLGFKPEKITLKRARRIPQNILDYLPEKELLALTRLQDRKDLLKPIKVHYRIELNAFTPEQFLNWVTEKIEDQGTKPKVRPPDNIIEEETHLQTDENLDKYIKNLMFQLFGGQQTVNQWKEQITKQKSLDTLDLRQVVDETLKTFPLDGWKEIIQQQVSSYVETIFKDSKATEEATKYILSKFEEQNTKNCTE